MPVIASPADNRLLLRNISWETYERLLSESVDNPGTRFTYDEGNLEIMVLSIGHEMLNRTLALLAEVTAEETGRNFRGAGSTTFRRKDRAKGFEPDSCFYFGHAASIRRKKEIDLTVDPPPELVIEVDISRSSLDRLPIFAAIGVTEIWRYDGERVRFYALESDVYRMIEQSVVLPPITAMQATIFLDQDRSEEPIAWLRAVRAWVREHSVTR
jgi:Uma2 family endonuclease